MNCRSRHSHGLEEAQRDLQLVAGESSSQAQPSQMTLPGRKTRVLDDQLDIDGNVLHPDTGRRRKSRGRC